MKIPKAVQATIESFEKLPGVGPKRKKALLDALGDVERIRAASVEDLRAISGMSEKAARAIWDRFRKPGVKS